MRKIMVSLGLLLLSAMAFAEPAMTIRFGTEATYPPFEYIDANGQMQGFDIELAKALCQQLKAECSFSHQSFNSLIPSLNLGKFDALIAALGITALREQQVDFTKPYYHMGAGFVVPQNKHVTLKDLQVKTIGVQEGATFLNYLQDRYPKANVKRYASVQDAFLDLVSGRVDAVLTDNPIAEDWLKQGHAKDYNVVALPKADNALLGSGLGIAVRKGNTTLLQALNKALQEIKANGNYNKLYQKYFGHSAA